MPVPRQDSEQSYTMYVCVMLKSKQFINHHIFGFSCRMAESTTSRYESNYIKIAVIVLQVSPRAIRVQFDKEFHHDCLQRSLNRNVFLLTELKVKKRITQPQWNVLFPRTGRLLYLLCLS